MRITPYEVVIEVTFEVDVHGGVLDDEIHGALIGAVGGMLNAARPGKPFLEEPRFTTRIKKFVNVTRQEQFKESAAPPP